MFRSAVRKKGPSEDSCICVMHLENKNCIQQTWLLYKALIFFLYVFSYDFENLKSKYLMSKLFWKIYLIFSEMLFGKKHWSHEQFKQRFMNNYPENDKLIMLKRRIFRVIKKRQSSQCNQSECLLSLSLDSSVGVEKKTVYTTQRHPEYCLFCLYTDIRSVSWS